MKETVFDAWLEASKRYKPLKLSQYLIKETDGTVVVDRARAAGDERLFCVTLHSDYGWRYRDFEHVTIYYEIDGEKVIGGVYNTRTKERETRRIVATGNCSGVVRHYVHSCHSLMRIIEAMQNAPQRAK